MTVIRLGGIQKEIYLKNLIMATEVLIKGLKDDDSLRKSKWDILVYEEIIKILENIKQLFYLLRRNTEDEDYKNNFGIYKEIILSNGGLPEFFSYRQLLEDKALIDEKVNQILESENIISKEDLVKKWIDRANNDMLSDKEYKREYLLEILPEKFQTIEFYEKIKGTEIFDIRDPMKNLSIEHIPNVQIIDRYIISWFNYMLGFGIWNIYIVQLYENISESKKNHIFKRDNIPSKGHFIPQEKSIYIDPEFKKFLEDHMNSGAFFLAREIDKSFPTIFPELISRFQFGPNFVRGISSGSLDFSWLYEKYPEAFFLTAVREDIKSSEKDNDKLINIGTKLSWSTNKFVEQRFGICSKELEKSLKEYTKFPNMRLYTV